MREKSQYIASVYIVALFFIKCNILWSQSTFSETIDFNGNQETAEAVVVYDNSILLIGSGLDIDDYLVSLNICKTDLQGNVVWRRTFKDDSSSLFSGLNAIADNTGIIYITGTHEIEPFEEANAFLCTIDPSNGDTILYKEFIEPGIEAGYRVQWLPDSSILLFGVTSVGGYSKILLMNVNRIGEVIFNEYYGTGIVRNTRYFQTDDNGNILIAFGDEDCDPTGYYFYSIDPVGNISSIFHSDINCFEWGVPSLTDDGYYIASYEYYIYKMTFFGKLNNEFSYEWKNYFEPDDVYFLYAQYELNDGTVIVYGSKRNTGTGDNEHAFLRKINEFGETIWEREYYTEEEFYPSYIWNISETPTGELICVGTGFGEPLLETGFLSQNFWLLKLDSLGCLEEGCDTIGYEAPPLPINFPAISIYPNPLSNQGTIQINLDLVDINNISYFEFELRDIAGHILNEYTIDQFHWTITNDRITIPFTRGTVSRGMYFIQIKTSNKIIGNLKVLLL